MLRPDGDNAHSLIINIHASKRDCVPLAHIQMCSQVMHNELNVLT